MKKTKKVGSVIRPSNSGLGNLAWDFYRNGIIDKCILLPSVKGDYFPERFGDDIKEADHEMLSQADVEWLLKDIDVLFLFETAYNTHLIQVAKDNDIKTILMPMHEGDAGWVGQEPDIWVCPSDLEYELPLRGGKKVRLNVPVDTTKLPQKLRKRAKVFVHNAGHGGMMFRNGTPELIEALKYTDKDFKLILRSQTIPFDVDDPRVQYEYANYENYWDLWHEGDVFIMPDKFAGLSMPLQEAYASGFMVITTNHNPLNKWLPGEPLIKPLEQHKYRPHYSIDTPDPEAIAEAIDKWYDKDISKFSRQGLEWAKENSWEKLKDKYIELCEQ